MHMKIQQTDQFRKWLHRLRDHAAKARITARIRQCGLAGQPVGDMHPVGKGGTMVNISSFDASEYIENEEDAIAYLNAAAETGDPALLQAAIGDIAKARGMGQIAKEAGGGRESLYKSLNKEGNPSFRTIVKVVDALGGRLVIEPAPATA